MSTCKSTCSCLGCAELCARTLLIHAFWERYVAPDSDGDSDSDAEEDDAYHAYYGYRPVIEDPTDDESESPPPSGPWTDGKAELRHIQEVLRDRMDAIIRGYQRARLSIGGKECTLDGAGGVHFKWDVDIGGVSCVCIRIQRFGGGRAFVRIHPCSRSSLCQRTRPVDLSIVQEVMETVERWVGAGLRAKGVPVDGPLSELASAERLEARIRARVRLPCSMDRIR